MIESGAALVALGVTTESRARVERAASRVAAVRELDGSVASTPDVAVLSGSDAHLSRQIAAFRASGDTALILALRTESSVAGVCALLKAGADITLPIECSDDELEAVLGALIRRGRQYPLRDDAELELEPATRTLELWGARFHFGPVAFRVLCLLVENRDRWSHKDQIIKSALGTCHRPDSSVVRVQIHQLRRVLGPYRECIQSDPLGGRGYMFTTRLTKAHAPARMHPVREWERA
jgi:DNA-binding response OmpR family regulator